MKIYRLLKFIHIVLHVIFGFIFILFFPFLNQDIRFKIIELWSTWFLKILKIKLTVNEISTNIENKSKYFFAANHISWVDIVILNSIKPSSFVAKSSIRKWPFLGFMISMSNTIFIDRVSKKSLKLAFSKVSSVLNRSSVVIFPEGKATLGKSVNVFHSNFFQIPINKKICVNPISIRYKKEGNFTDVIAYVGDDKLLNSLLKIINLNGFEAVINLHDQIPTNDKNRKELAFETYSVVKECIEQEG